MLNESQELTDSQNRNRCTRSFSNKYPVMAIDNTAISDAASTVGHLTESSKSIQFNSIDFFSQNKGEFSVKISLAKILI